MLPAPAWAPIPFVVGGISAIILGIFNRRRDRVMNPRTKSAFCLALACSGLVLFLTVPIVLNFGFDWLLAVCLFACSFIWLSAGRYLSGGFTHLLRKGLNDK